jgi:hypothetical protein
VIVAFSELTSELPRWKSLLMIPTLPLFWAYSPTDLVSSNPKGGMNPMA